ncbi:MAG: hypothetical protein P4L28_01450 [Paludibacteraceae bacterium]|nr:hypothetical protein [Paludibacteraceae bacterium]
MKKIIVSIIGLLGCSALWAQYPYDPSEFDALKYSQPDITGTARYMSMGGAFGALGGDASSIGLNPAGLGVYRSSELSITSGVVHTTTSADWNGKNGTEDKYTIPLNNLTYVISYSNNDKEGLVSSNFAFSFNKIKNFDRNVYVKGGQQTSSLTNYMAGLSSGLSGGTVSTNNNSFNNTNVVPWLSILGNETYLINSGTGSDTTKWSGTNTGGYVRPTYSLSEEGYINEWSLSYAANISNKLYLGAYLGILDLNYDATTRYTEDFATSGNGFTLVNNYHTDGTGINLKVGAIYRPTSSLRLGLSIATPNFLSLTSRSYASISSSTDSAASASISTPKTSSDYEVQGPVQYNLSAAYTFGKLGLVSVDYGLADYSGIKLHDNNGNSSSFIAENQGASNYLKNVQTLRVGAEFKVDDQFSIRGGYALVTSATKDDALKLLRWNTTTTDPGFLLDDKTNYYSLGFGYRNSNGWFIDFAYQLKVCKQNYYAYGTTTDSSLSDYNASDRYAYATSNLLEPAKITTKNNNFILTLGCKF